MCVCSPNQRCTLQDLCWPRRIEMAAAAAAASLKNMLPPAFDDASRLPATASSLASWPCHNLSVVLSLAQMPSPSPHGPWPVLTSRSPKRDRPQRSTHQTSLSRHVLPDQAVATPSRFCDWTPKPTSTLGVNDMFHETFCGGGGREQEVSPASVPCTRAKEAGPGKGEGWGDVGREWTTTMMTLMTASDRHASGK